jgi:general secretion pathway protein C
LTLNEELFNLIKVLENSLKKFRFLNSLLAVLILFAILLTARNIIRISFLKKEAPRVTSQDRSSIPMNIKDIFHYAPILELNPFGEPMKLHPIAIEEKKEKTYGALSNLILIGTVAGPQNLSYAIFEDKSLSSKGKQEVFAYKDEVFNYGILTKIDQSSVEIERDSVTYSLTILFDEIRDKTKKQTRSRSAPPKTSFARKVGDQQYVLDKRKVQKSLENPEQILTDARLLPNFVKGKQKGFRISEVVPDGLYHSLGIRNGDILLRVNGLEISNPEVAMQAMNALRGMNKVNLDIIRKGENMSMSYQMR